ncbi:type IV pilus biogenesis protein PilM [Mixta intestinalis]|uniref:Pilus assembly protein n=1 Tax=Mixta intestinalis TaxID=1615494 RepID=A0A6P1Q653_9GAMM|nr:pilus assembly protein PilM [Mixta intestinalis]QHM73507.1 hypothetical protein C7M51_03854 [Mixta intestinalis]
MAFQNWQVGLDIQNGQLCALAIQRRRNGWQLRHWWQHALPHNTLNNGTLIESPDLITLLRRWRKQLPRKISLRIGFPSQAVLQRYLAAPPQQLREPELGRYASAAAERLFPLTANELALDYCAVPQPQMRLCLTAARQSIVKQWLLTLTQADLAPDVVAPASSALETVGELMQLPMDAALIHQLSDHWLWFMPGREEAVSGWAPGTLIMESGQLAQVLPAAQQFWFSAALSAELLMGMQPLQPLSLLRFIQPPLPANGGLFTLALGLALHQEGA